MYTNVHSSFLCDSQKIEITKMSFNRLMDKQIMAHPYNGILLEVKRETVDKSKCLE